MATFLLDTKRNKIQKNLFHFMLVNKTKINLIEIEQVTFSNKVVREINKTVSILHCSALKVHNQIDYTVEIIHLILGNLTT